MHMSTQTRVANPHFRVLIWAPSNVFLDHQFWQPQQEERGSARWLTPLLSWSEHIRLGVGCVPVCLPSICACESVRWLHSPWDTATHPSVCNNEYDPQAKRFSHPWPLVSMRSSNIAQSCTLVHKSLVGIISLIGLKAPQDLVSTATG